MPRHLTDLEEILRQKRQLLEARKRQVPIRGVRAQAKLQPRPIDVPSVLKDGSVSLIAEVKRASPTGLLVQSYDPVVLAQLYQQSGVAALSVATDEAVLRGNLAHLMRVKQAVTIPVLRQDFIFDEYQIVEARAAGADGVRIIAGVLEDRLLRRLLSLTQRLKMSALIEVHTEAELEQVIPLDPRLIGLNNRDWETGEVNLTLTERLRGTILPHIAVVSEGGIKTAEDVKRIAAVGVDAIVVGEALLTAEDIAAKLREFIAIL